LAEKYNKKIILFYNDDNDKIFNFENSIIFRTSLYKSTKPKNYYSLPAFCNDLKNTTNFFLREKSTIPTIGFCGAITNEFRIRLINEFEKSEKINKNFLIRDRFWGGDVWGKNVREDYIKNTLNSDFILCVRGAGNFSYRIYETLCLGRIPIILDTDIDLPFEEFLGYKNKFPVIQVGNINESEDIVLSYYENIHNFKELQKEFINLWENHLSPLGFIKTLNSKKNEINSLLH
jgi:hypothetical protein